MEGYYVIGTTDINNAYAFRMAANEMGYKESEIVINVIDRYTVYIYAKMSMCIDVNSFLDLGRRIVRGE